MRRICCPKFLSLAVGLVLVATFADAAGAAERDAPLVRQVLPIEPADRSVFANRGAVLTFRGPTFNNATPAVLLVHDDPGGVAVEPGDASRFLAEPLARAGYSVLSVYSRLPHWQDRATVESVAADIRGGLDWLSQADVPGVVIGGHGIGALAAAMYAATAKDRRVRGLIAVAPFPDLPEWLRERLGDAEYAGYAARAAELAAAGEAASSSYLYTRTLRQPPADLAIYAGFVHDGPTWLKWWGPEAGTRLSRVAPQVAVPAIYVAGARDGVATPQSVQRVAQAATAAGRSATFVEIAGADHAFSGRTAETGEAVLRWLGSVGIVPRRRVDITFADATVEGCTQPAVVYAPAEGPRERGTAFVLLREYHNDLLRRSNHWLGLRVAQAGYTGFAPRVRPLRFNDATTNEEAIVDIATWIDHVERRGFRRIVLVGHGAGANRAAQYQAVRRDPRVAALVLLSPGPEIPEWTTKLLGEEKLAASVAEARAAIAAGDGDRMVFAAGMQPPPAPPAPWVIQTMPAQFLSDWGPDSQLSLTKLLPRLTVPVTIVQGSGGLFLTEADVVKLGRLAPRPFEPIVYRDGAPHSLAGFEDRVAADVLAWVRGTLAR